jgi:hypothetical protein
MVESQAGICMDSHGHDYYGVGEEVNKFFFPEFSPGGEVPHLKRGK